MKKTIIIFILIQIAFVYANDFQNGNIEYSKGNLIKAKEHYLNDIKERGETFNTLYNLGSLELSQGNNGYSKYYLTKAQLLKPRDKELSSLLTKIEIKRNYLTSNEKKSITLLLFFLFSITVFLKSIMKLFNTQINSKVLILIPLLLCISFIFALTFSYIETINRKRGVILENSMVYISPYNESEESFNIDSGADVYVTDEFKNYFYIKDNQDRYGWISKNDIGTLWN